MPTTTDRAAFIRESMRRSWSTRTRAYTEDAAPNTAEFARRLLSLQPPRPGERVLDVATGPGVVSVAAATLAGSTGRVVATDLASEWAEIIAERAAAAGVTNVIFRAMGAEALDLPDGAFDVAYCQFGLMFVPEPVQALREMRRVLRDGGRLGIVVWSTADRVLCFSVVNRHLAPYLPKVPPEQELPTPLALGEPGLIERLAAEAGFREIASERHTLEFVAGSPEDVWRTRVERGQPAIQAAVAALAPPERERLRDALIAEVAHYQRDGSVRLPSEAIFLRAVK
ncbi:MAG: methyltransferase domain-containing protein [Chloroflexi bacterium]|nr:methyltransferase domain-containing protein [Chloroflexota bacterium]